MSAMHRLGFGIGLRPKHYRDFLENSPTVDFVEAISENFMGVGGRPRAVLEKVRQERPVVLHGVSLAVASTESLDEEYLRAWKELIAQIDPVLVSDHLCWGRAHRRYAHDLLPVPLTEEALVHTVRRVAQVQEFLGRRIALENVSSYLTFAQSEMAEWEFLAEVATRADCLVLLDVNNVFVSSRNHGSDVEAFLAGIPVERVAQIHLAGHQRRPELILDTHDGPVSDEVWALYQRAIARFGQVPTLIEWDDSVPAVEVVVAEATKAKAYAQHVSKEAARPHITHKPQEKRSSPGLQHTQRLLFEAVCNAEPIAEAASVLVTERAPLSNVARIEVYAEMYWLRMRDTLREAFPSVRQQVGDETFDVWVARFMRAHPSTNPSLDRFGAAFPRFLADVHPPLADCATLEWAQAESFIAPDAPTASFAELQAVDSEKWAAVTLTAHPSLRVLRLTSDPRPLRRGHAAGEGPLLLAVWRQGFEVVHVAVNVEEARALEALQRGATLLELMEPFADHGDDGTAAFAALRSWFSEGIIASLYVGSPSIRDERAV